MYKKYKPIILCQDHYYKSIYLENCLYIPLVNNNFSWDKIIKE